MNTSALNEPLLSVRDLTVGFTTERGPITAIDGIGFDLGRGEVLGMIDESGSGKSVTMRALLRILPRANHHIRIDNDGRAGRAVAERTCVGRLSRRQLCCIAAWRRYRTREPRRS